MNRAKLICVTHHNAVANEGLRNVNRATEDLREFRQLIEERSRSARFIAEDNERFDNSCVVDADVLECHDVSAR